MRLANERKQGMPVAKRNGGYTERFIAFQDRLLFALTRGEPHWTWIQAPLETP